MYGRNRSPRNGYRGGGAGGGIGLTPSRSFNSDYRNFNRGFGRGGHPSPRTSQVSPPLPPPPPPPPPSAIHNHHHQQQQQLRNPSPPTHKPDLFIEAGRLAAKYLVSQGILPSEFLSTNGSLSLSSLKNNNVDHNQESDGNSSCKTSPSNYYGGLRISARDGRSGKVSSPGTNDGSGGVSRENEVVSLSESDRAAEFNDNVSSAEVDSKVADSEVCKPISNSNTAGLAVASKTTHNELPYEITEKCNTYSGTGNNGADAASCTSEYSSNGHQTVIHTEHEKTTVGANNEVIEKDNAPVQEGMAIEQCEEGSNASTEKNTSEVCHSETGHVESQLSLTGTGAKTSNLSVPEDGDTGDHDHGCKLSIKTLGSECPDFHNSRASSSLSVKNVGGQSVYAINEEKRANPQTCIDKTFVYDQQLSEALPEFQRCKSLVEEKGEKRALEDEYMDEGAKKAKHWPSFGSVDEHSHFSDPMERCSSTRSLGPPAGDNLVEAPNHESSIGDFLFLRSGGLPPVEYNEEKHLFPGSFRICDLNLMDVTDINTNHSHFMPACPSTSETNKEAPVDVDLSMSNNCTSANGYSSVAKEKEVELIDLEGNSFPGDRSFNLKSQAELAGIERLPSHGQNPDDNPDAQDGYGLMISELIGTDIPNCHSVQPEIQPLGNEVGLPPGEVSEVLVDEVLRGAGQRNDLKERVKVILNDDDQIYMSFGEIPLSILRMWEQPTQDYEKQL